MISKPPTAPGGDPLDYSLSSFNSEAIVGLGTLVE